MPEYSFLNLEMIAESQAQKEVTANAILEALAKGAGAFDVSVAAGNVTLTEAESHYGVIRLTGAPGAARVVTVDADISRGILFVNATTGGQVIEVEQFGGTNFPVPPGGSVLLLSTTQGITFYPRSVVTLIFLSTGTTFTNMPAALTPVFSVRRRIKYDLTAFTQARIITDQSGVGFAGATLRGYFSTTSGGVFAALDGATGPEVDAQTATVKESSWVNLTATAKQEVYLEVYGINGDGIADPGWQLIALQFR